MSKYINPSHQDDFIHKYDQLLISPYLSKLPKFTPKLKLGILASGNGSNFEALVNSTRDNTLSAKVECLVVNNPECYALRRAERLGIPIEILNHRDYKSRQELDKKIISIFEYLEIDIIVMAGWMRIVTEVLINKYKDRIVNVHPSLLPSFKGVNAVQQALEAKVKFTGCTVHLVNKEIDSGLILAQSIVPILPEYTHSELLKKIQDKEHKILPIGVAMAGRMLRVE